MRLLNASPVERGETMIGLMIGLAVGFIVLAGGIAFFANSVSNNREVLQSRVLNQDLKSVMDLMVKEIRRAQYIENAETLRIATSCHENDKFCLDDDGFLLPSDHQIEFSYDKDGSCLPPLEDPNNTSCSIHDDECLGFRCQDCDDESAIGSVQIKTICDDTNAEQWQDMTDPSTIDITDLSFFVCCSPSSGAAFYNRRVNIRLTGQLVSDPNRLLTLEEAVSVRSAIPADSKPSYCGACANTADPCYPCTP